MVFSYIDSLIAYALNKGLITKQDEIYTRNQLLGLLGLDAYQPPGALAGEPLDQVLNALADHARQYGRCDEGHAAADRFGTALMGAVTPRPSEVSAEFGRRYATGPRQATEYFYGLCQDANYISRSRMERDIRWKTLTQYGELDITINLSKPEKDPRDIAEAGRQKASGYPACLLCMENEGYAGRAGHPARQNLRIVPVELAGARWGLQYSPYIYYNEHCIVLSERHTPIIIDKAAFEKLLDFVRQFPHYFAGSNADLPIVGGSILSHEHFQGGFYQFAMERAPVEAEFAIKAFMDVKAGIVKWPMSVIRIAHGDIARLAGCAAHILEAWREYSDAAVGIYAHTAHTPHNTITPIARFREGKFELDLVLRNNIATEEHPLGLFHPHAELHNIKKENIGLIEVMGLAVLPARLRDEMGRLKQALIHGENIRGIESINKHADWVDGWRKAFPLITNENADEILRGQIGRSFETVLEHAGVFKRDRQGREAFAYFTGIL